MGQERKAYAIVRCTSKCGLVAFIHPVGFRRKSVIKEQKYTTRDHRDAICDLGISVETFLLLRVYKRRFTVVHIEHNTIIN